MAYSFGLPAGISRLRPLWAAVQLKMREDRAFHKNAFHLERSVLQGQVPDILHNANISDCDGSQSPAWQNWRFRIVLNHAAPIRHRPLHTEYMPLLRPAIAAALCADKRPCLAQFSGGRPTHAALLTRHKRPPNAWRFPPFGQGYQALDPGKGCRCLLYAQSLQPVPPVQTCAACPRA